MWRVPRWAISPRRMRARLAAEDAGRVPAGSGADPTRSARPRGASFLSAFTIGKGYSADADYSARAWLMHRTGITRGAAASHTAWAKRGRGPSPRRRGAGCRGPVVSPTGGRSASGRTNCRRSSGRSPTSCWWRPRGGRAGAGGPVGAVRGDVRAGPARPAGRGPGPGVRGTAAYGWETTFQGAGGGGGTERGT